MKKILLSLLVVLMCFSLVGCKENGTSEVKDNNSAELQGSAEKENSLKNLSTKNYKKVVKEIFGINVVEEDSLKIEKAESINKVNDLAIKWDIQENIDGKELFKKYYDESSKVAKDGVYKQGVNDSFTAIVKKEKYNTFEDAYKDITSDDTFFSGMWIYDNAGKNVQFGLTIDTKLGYAELSLVKLG